LSGGLRQVGKESLLIVPSIVARSPGDAVDLGLSFSDGTASVTLKGVVRWNKPAPPSAKVPFLVGVGLDFPTTLIARRIASGGAQRAKRPRRFDRFDTSILVGVQSPHAAGPGRIEDISLGGAKVLADLEPLPQRGEIVIIEFVEARLRLKGKPIRGRVMWVASGPGSQSFGVQFEEVDPQTRDVIQREVSGASAGKKPKP
jgi:hypothetical protein